MHRHRALGVGLALLAGLQLLVLFAGFWAPYDPTTQHRSFPYTAPTRIRLFDQNGVIRRPFIFREVPRTDGLGYEPDLSTRLPVRFFVQGSEYGVLGILRMDRHIIGVDEPGQLFLLGSDEYGRDLFSRLVHGTAYSLAAACAATLVSLSLGVLLGLVAGYYGGWVDEVVMRFAEMFVALPWLYLLLAARAFLPLDLDARGAFFLIVTLIGMIGWARPARLVRGMVLSVRQHDYVSASRGFGATDRHVLREHVLPQTYAVVLPQAAILLPHYMLAEVSLSFFGLGVPEPAASLGNVLAPLQRYHVLVSYWWMFLPALTVVVITLMYQMVANSLEERLKCAGC